MFNTLKSINNDYLDVLRHAQKRLSNRRIRFKGVKGRIKDVSFSREGVVVDVAMDDGNEEKTIRAIDLEFL